MDKKTIKKLDASVLRHKKSEALEKNKKLKVAEKTRVKERKAEDKTRDKEWAAYTKERSARHKREGITG